MHVPERVNETVITPEGRGTWTGNSGQFDEHYEIDLHDGDTVMFHYEDLK